MMHFPPYGDILSPIPVTSISGNIVDVTNGVTFPACVHILDGKVSRVERRVNVPQRFILPGLVDAHIHLESTMLTPYRFAEQAMPHGTTAVVADPHEIANIMGMDGIRYMVEDGKNTPLRFFFTAPSCVPATSQEGAEAAIGWKEVMRLLSRPDFVALGEVMNYPAVLEDDPEIMAKIEVAALLGKPVDGHCPGLTGYDLIRYINAGISTDHECTTIKEAQEKHGLGMMIMVRDGTAARNLNGLLPFARRNEHFLVTDDLDAMDLTRGHLDEILRKAIAGGIEPIHAIRAVSIWPARHYGLPGGSLDPGKPADLAVVNNLKEFKVQEVYIGGKLVARDGVCLFMGTPVTAPLCITPQHTNASEFLIRSTEKVAKVRVVEAFPDIITRGEIEALLETVDGTIRPDPTRDILLMAVVNRYMKAPPSVGFIKGFNLKIGAIASSVSHDMHNIITVGADHYSMAVAVNTVSLKGGYYATDGKRGIALELPVAGLMSTQPCAEVAAKGVEILSFVRGLGCDLPSPFMTLSFQNLPFMPLALRRRISEA